MVVNTVYDYGAYYGYKNIPNLPWFFGRRVTSIYKHVMHFLCSCFHMEFVDENGISFNPIFNLER